MNAVVEPILETRNLVKRFGGLVAVDGISFSIRHEEILALIGPNGSGKSTVLKMVMGIHRASSGEVILHGTNITSWRSHRIARRGIGIVFQHSRPLRRQTVLDNIKLTLLSDSIWPRDRMAEIESRALELGARVGLADVMQRYPNTLPYADLRRIEMARAIARDPEVLLIDEPFAGLASDEVREFADLIRQERDAGRAILLVDHNVKSVVALADRIYAMYLGRPVAEGDPDEVMRHETVRRVYLGGELQKSSAVARSRVEAKTLLEVAHLDVAYDKATALEDVSLTVPAGGFVSVVGLNGAGKTTLFNAISGFVPYQGKIVFDDKSLSDEKPSTIARSGLVQCPESRELFTTMSVRDNLELGGAHMDRKECAEQLGKVCALFPILKQREHQIAGTLSGGEQQMLAIGRALMMRPKLLILDEPTLGLAPVILEQLSSAMEQLREESEITILLGEQNVRFALTHADIIYVLEHARIIWSGQPDRFVDEMGAKYL